MGRIPCEASVFQRYFCLVKVSRLTFRFREILMSHWFRSSVTGNSWNVIPFAVRPLDLQSGMQQYTIACDDFARLTGAKGCLLNSVKFPVCRLEASKIARNTVWKRTRLHEQRTACNRRRGVSGEASEGVSCGAMESSGVREN